MAWLEVIFANKESYAEKTTAMETETQNIIAKYDAGHIRQDDIIFLAGMEATGSNGMEVKSINMFNPEEVVNTLAVAAPTVAADGTVTPPADATAAAPAPADGTAQADGTAPAAADGAIAPAPDAKYALKLVDNGISMYKVPLDYSFQVSYSGLKNVMDYVYSVGGRKSVDSVTLSFDTNTGLLAGTMKLNRYFLTGTDRIYSPENIPSMSTGVGNIFRTVEAGGATVQREVTEEVQEEAQEEEE